MVLEPLNCCFDYPYQDDCIVYFVNYAKQQFYPCRLICSLGWKALSEKSDSQFGESFFHGGFNYGKESHGKLVLLLLLYNALTHYNIEAQKSAFEMILLVAMFLVTSECMAGC